VGKGKGKESVLLGMKKMGKGKALGNKTEWAITRKVFKKA
jgi:hypothetical protein